jgi:hypothetical protein
LATGIAGNHKRKGSSIAPSCLLQLEAGVLNLHRNKGTSLCMIGYDVKALRYSFSYEGVDTGV